jgi:RNA polymerase sigma factor (TIGR02999 family)
MNSRHSKAPPLFLGKNRGPQAARDRLYPGHARVFLNVHFPRDFAATRLLPLAQNAHPLVQIDSKARVLGCLGRAFLAAMSVFFWVPRAVYLPLLFGLRDLMPGGARTMIDVTRVLSAIEAGDPQAAEQLLPLVYDELRKLAAVRLSQEKPGQTLQATALVHEAYLRLVDTDKVWHWNSRGHFFAAAAEAMRRILIEQARHRRTLKAGGVHDRIALSDVPQVAPEEPLDLIALDEALQKLERHSPRRAELVKLRYFAGLTIEQAAQALGVAASTASADWVYAKSWLRLEMRSSN